METEICKTKTEIFNGSENKNGTVFSNETDEFPFSASQSSRPNI
jgi:hypothetical protein